MRPILVVGATGLLGSEVCRTLCASKLPVRALVRPGSPREELLRRYGAEIAPGRLGDTPSLEASCKGASAILATATAERGRLPGDSLRGVDRDGMRTLVDAARRGGVRRFVFVSVSPNLPVTTPLVRYKRETEAALRGSGMAWVVVQPSAFMETWLDRGVGFDGPGGKAAIVGSGEVPVSYVSVRDVARVLASVASPLSEVSRAYLPVGGPAAVTPLDVVRIFEEEIGRSITVLRAPAAIARGAGALLRPFNATRSSTLGIAAHRAVAGDVIESSLEVREMVGRPTSVRDFARSKARAEVTDPVRALLGGAGGQV